MRDNGVRHSLVADARGQRTRVDAGDGDDAAALQPRVEVSRRAVVRRIGDAGAQHAAAHARARGEVRGLGVLGVGADVADVREGEGDDLAGVGGIGQHLLVARHGGVEAHLADGAPGRAEAHAGNHRPVVQHQAGRGGHLGPGRGRGGHRLCSSLGSRSPSRTLLTREVVRSKPGPWIAADPMRGGRSGQEKPWAKAAARGCSARALYTGINRRNFEVSHACAHQPGREGCHEGGRQDAAHDAAPHHGRHQGPRARHRRRADGGRGRGRRRHPAENGQATPRKHCHLRESRPQRPCRPGKGRDRHPRRLPAEADG